MRRRAGEVPLKKAVKKEMIEYNNAKQNVDRLLGITHLQEKSKEKEH